MTTTRTRLALMMATACLIMAACTPSTPPDTHPDDPPSSAAQGSQSGNEAADASYGPLADANRPLAERSISTNDAGSVQRVAIDFGNTTSGRFSAPKRGTLILPAQPLPTQDHPTQNAPTQAPPAQHAPTQTPPAHGTATSELIILSHLRAPNCQDRSFAYPCPTGVNEFRYDEGMTYLGDHLAEQGYTVIIPDLGGIFIGADLQEPYSQTAMWEDVVTTFIDALRTDSEGTTNIFGVPIVRPVDLTRVGLFAHSRSGQLIESALKVAGQGNLKGVFAYGPAYDTVELEHISPPIPDVPFLALVGDADADVGPSANLLLGHYATTARTTPASVAEVPGLGHMYINRAASAAAFDDRIGCDVLDCPDAAAHETSLSAAATDWFNAVLRGADTSLPVAASSPLPQEVGGLPARWLALTPNALASVDASAMTATGGGTLSVCTFAEGMTPRSAGTPCPEPEVGSVQILTPVAHVTKGATAPLNVSGVRGLSVHLAPSGIDEAAHATAVRVTVHLADGQERALSVPADHPALASKRTEVDDGTYRLGTIRLDVEDLPADAVISGISVQTEGGPINLRSVDVWR